MSDYILEVIEGQKLTAGTKAKEDIAYFLERAGFKKLKISVPKNKWSRPIIIKKCWKKILKDFKSGDTLYYQYPAYSRYLGDIFIKEAEKKEIRKVLIVHDLEALRYYKDQPKNRARELSFINKFDYVIAHNQKMKDWLIHHGVIRKIINLEIFDYKEQAPLSKGNKDMSLVFAGNLGKSQFLSQLDLKKKIELFGVSPAERYPDNIHYNGTFSPEELGEKMQGSFGIVWDGETVKECSGITGEYMKYNNPHKVSLYLTLGIPVIIWSEAALSSFVVENQVGFSVSDLSEIDEKIAALSDQQYQNLKSNAQLLSEKLRSGYFIKQAVATINEV
ncbi:hypothetical protein D920_00051 [Enterococcus faecalis 13-SD-W-01]|nr:hypothetical protein D920_00051 [Enterococcus faecalis 13-SD-W-01]